MRLGLDGRRQVVHEVQQAVLDQTARTFRTRCRSVACGSGGGWPLRLQVRVSGGGRSHPGGATGRWWRRSGGRWPLRPGRAGGRSTARAPAAREVEGVRRRRAAGALRARVVELTAGPVSPVGDGCPRLYASYATRVTPRGPSTCGNRRVPACAPATPPDVRSHAEVGERAGRGNLRGRFLIFGGATFETTAQTPLTTCRTRGWSRGCRRGIAGGRACWHASGQAGRPPLSRRAFPPAPRGARGARLGPGPLPPGGRESVDRPAARAALPG